MFDVLSIFLNAVVGAVSYVVNALTYVPYCILVNLLPILDFDPFDELITQYNPATLVGQDFVNAWTFVNHWIPVADCLVFVSLTFGILGACIVIRLVYNWLKIASSGD